MVRQSYRNIGINILIILLCSSSVEAKTTNPADIDNFDAAPQNDFLVCPPPPKAEESWLTGSEKEEKQVNRKRLASIKVNALDIQVEMRDANPLFMPANEGAWKGNSEIYPTLNGSTSIHDLSYTELMAMLEHGQARVGVAADGVSQLLIAVRSNAAGTFELEMKAEPIGASTPATGEIQLLGGGKTCDTGEGHVAFALYQAPGDFGRQAGMGPARDWLQVENRFAEARAVWLDVSFELASGSRIEKSKKLTVVRPPVVLVHGAYDSGAGAWVTKSERVKRLEESIPTKTFPELLEKTGFVPFVVDYENSNGTAGQGELSSFWNNRYVVWNNGTGSWLNPNVETLYKEGESARSGGIRKALEFFRDELKIAATRADVIGHSMGGILSRVYASDWDPADADPQISATLVSLDQGGCQEQTPYNPQYRRPDNFGQGDINRLITLGTPHHGSELPVIFDLVTRMQLQDESMKSSLTRDGTYYSAWFLAAQRADTATTRDLALGSCALRRIGPTNVRSHAVAGVTATANLDDPDYGSYLLKFELLSALFYYNPELVQKLIALVSEDYVDTPWANKFPYEISREFEDALASEYEKWIELEQNHSGWMGAAVVHKTYAVPMAIIEALRGLIFRFDKNDATVRVDSQTAGLAVDSPFVTYIANERTAKVQQSVLHSFEPRYVAVQSNLVKLLWSKPEDRFIASLPPAGQKMMPHAPPEDFGVDLKLTGSFAKKWSGMDFRHADAFLEVAEKNHVVILARPVNPDATELIIRGAATKGMNVKGKSSNWGPQKGYIPVDQRYSKLWRTAGADRDKEVEKFSGKTKSLLKANNSSYRNKENKPIAIGRQLKHTWNNQVYSVWMDPDIDDAEQSIFLCRGAPANSDSVMEYDRGITTTKEQENELDEKVTRERKELEQPCSCDEWFDWRTAGTGFDIKNEPGASVELKNCANLRPLQVLADNTHKDLAFLTADYDLLTIGFHCPQGKNTPLEACKAELKINRPEAVTDNNNPSCIEGSTQIVSADYSKGTPPQPWPCLDSDTGLITVAQVNLLEELNDAVRKKGYTGGNVSHHGPETQFFESPYVDYPITAFDPGVAGKQAARILTIPRGPEGFRDIHLKRFYEEKIRQGYWLYPNTYKSANWHWQEREREGLWRGWFYEDDPALGLGKSVDQISQPACVYREIRRRKVAPQARVIECTQDVGEADAL